MAACGGGTEPVSSSAVAPAPGDGSTGSANTATLTWDAVTDSDLSGYRIYYGTAPGTYLQPLGQGVNAGNVTSYTITGLSSGSRYYFTVTAFDMSNNESGFSNEVFKDIS